MKSKIAQNRKSIFLSSVQCCDRFAAILNGKRVQIRAEDNEKNTYVDHEKKNIPFEDHEKK